LSEAWTIEAAFIMRDFPMALMVSTQDRALRWCFLDLHGMPCRRSSTALYVANRSLTAISGRKQCEIGAIKKGDGKGSEQ